jgi:predicted MPP superfamily phosphohydrolase
MNAPDPAARARWLERRLALETEDRKHTPFGVGPRHRKQFRRLQRVLHVMLTLTGLHGRGRRNALDIRLTSEMFAFPDLPPEFDGYRLLNVADPHFDTLEGTDERIASLIADCPADLLVLSGDYRRRVYGPFEQVLAPMARVLDAARTPPEGRLAVLGNHDPAAMVPPLEALGLRVLVNETLTIRRGDAALHFTGFDDVHYFYTEAADKAAAAAPAGFRIALVHSPEFAFNAARAGYRLYLCGHTHGGQVCLPGGVPILTANELGHRFVAGRWQHEGMQGFTSRGAGTSGLPVRFFSRGEVTLITLRRGGEGPITP